MDWLACLPKRLVCCKAITGPTEKDDGEWMEPCNHNGKRKPIPQQVPSHSDQVKNDGNTKQKINRKTAIGSLSLSDVFEDEGGAEINGNNNNTTSKECREGLALTRICCKVILLVILLVAVPKTTMLAW